jgi:hypothetical protein
MRFFKEGDEMTSKKLVSGFQLLPGVPYDFGNYRQSEREVVTPALEGAGYEIIGGWYSPEADSFGPLSRAVTVRNIATNEIMEVFYA